ncbi:hypothetical protein C5167_005607 [Papaver somniferum]|uniref:GDSL esterase/lipase n=1 Tax=Papaver somniferum TaxID=3469 RepID=A0A4Y7JF82_PAPSO|nr:hypothetical protein C5167_005607 [Papaver somniferum]
MYHAGEELGVKDYIPPYMDPTTVGDVVLRGGNRFNMDAQLHNFANPRNYIISNISGVGSKKLIENALFIRVMGSNDFIDNYFTPIVSIPKQKFVSPEMFVDSMISKFRLQLTRMYEMDARKIAVANVGPVGCIPIERALYTTGDSCRSAMNDAAMLFNKKLKSLLVELNANLVESKFVYVDSYRVLSHIFDNYQSYGFEDFKTGCVKLLADPTLGMASPAPLVCKDRSKHVFWDVAHPTEGTYAIFAKKVIEDRDSTYTYPMNVRQLYYS